MDLREAILERRSIRRFKQNAPDADLILDILDVSRWAPTHCNTQEIRFIIVDDDAIKQNIVDMGGSVIIKNAPVGILVIYNNSSDNKEYLDYIQSASATIQNILLYSYSKGLATCWVAHLPRKSDLRSLFDIPAAYDPIAYILLGYPANDAKIVPRKYKIDDIVSVNKFRFKNVTSITKKPIIKSSIRRLYYRLPTIIKKVINPVVDKFFVKKFEN